jgi:flagellar hook capping protein FlgD
LQRFLTSATLVLLLVATAAAFAVTERLKLTKSPIYATVVGPKAGFSPKCGCARSKANIKIALRRADTVTVVVVDARRREVALLAVDAHYRRGTARFRWDGKLADGELAPDGVYRVKVHLARQHQTIVLPNDVRLDTKPPEVVNVVQNRDAFSPDGDKQADFVRLSYALSKPARLTLFLGGRRIQLTHLYPQRGATTWAGAAHGHTLRPGTYTLEVGALDLAGNSTAPGDRQRIHVRIRYIALATRHLTARAGKRFEVGVSTDAPKYRWQLGGRKGRNGGAVLRLQAPDKPGRYVLTVTERGHVDRARLVVK